MKILKNAAAGCALAILAIPGAALADDPNDPEMQSRAARERDAELVRMLNRDMLAQVTARDEAFKAGWQAHAEAPARQAEYRARLAEYEAREQAYAANRASYENAMAKWREDVAACRAGIWEACQ